MKYVAVFYLGAALGIFVTAMCTAASKGDDQ